MYVYAYRSFAETPFQASREAFEVLLKALASRIDGLPQLYKTRRLGQSHCTVLLLVCFETGTLRPE